MAKLIVIEGIDGVGKGTQSKLLLERIAASGARTRLISFPVYDSHFGRMIGEYLNGVYGTLETVHPKLAALLYAMDRVQCLEQLELADYDALVIDRYVPSNLAHQTAKLPGGERAELTDWILELEYGTLGLPTPELVVVLDADAELAARQVLKKDARAYTELEQDLHESDQTYLRQVRQVYGQLARERAEFRLVQCDRDGQMRSIEDIHEEIWRLVAEVLPEAAE
ncbi:dTMP kinase [Candidatus Sumerlaeota bacterium]